MSAPKKDSITAGEAAAEKAAEMASETAADTTETPTEVLEDEEFFEEEYKPSEADGDMFGGMPAKKAEHFWPSAKRLMGLLSPEAQGHHGDGEPREAAEGRSHDLGAPSWVWILKRTCYRG